MNLAKTETKKVFLFILHFLFSFLLDGQSLPNSNFQEDEKIALEVYEDLKITIGDKRRNWPELKLLSIENRVASFTPSDNIILLDQKTVRICRLFESKTKDALAFIIGHELTHFYQEHDWNEAGFAASFLISGKELIELRNYERKADIYGAFIAQQAGYQTIRLVPELLEQIYENYKLEISANKDYPSLSERKELANESCKVAANLVDAYQTANYAMILGKFEVAYQLYDFVSKSLQFKELYNNIGLSNLLQYYFLDTDNQLLYPFQIDPYIPLLRSEQTRSYNTLISESIKAFEKVNSQYDSNYFPAKLHLIMAYDWSKKSYKSEKIINNLSNITTFKQQSILELTIGNFYANNQQKPKAIRTYKSILNNSTNGDYIKNLTEKNLDYLETAISYKNISKPTKMRKVEKGIDEIASLPFFKKFKRKIEIKKHLYMEAVEFPNSYITKVGDLKIQRVYSTTIHTNKGIQIGSTDTMVKIAYPSIQLTQLRSADSYFLVHFEKGLIFKCNSDGIVVEWILFS